MELILKLEVVLLEIKREINCLYFLRISGLIYYEGSIVVVYFLIVWF